MDGNLIVDELQKQLCILSTRAAEFYAAIGARDKQIAERDARILAMEAELMELREKV